MILTAALAVTGCSAGGDGGSEKAEGAAAKADSSHPDDGRAAGSTVPEGEKAKPAKRSVRLAPTHIIRTAELEVRVKDVAKTLVVARRAAEGAGGHIADETTERLDSDSGITSRVVLRVPQERYDAVLAELEGAGKLLARRADAKDVTDQVVDVESRIATQRASVVRVRALMDRAEKLADVVTLEGQLSSRQAELESLLAQRASLKDRTTLSTITLTLSEAAGKERKEPADDDPAFLDALGGGWDALGTTVRWIGVVIGAVAPFAAVLAVFYAVWRWLVRPRLSKRRTAVTGAPAPLPAYGTAPAPERD
ncbi:DUF4349 domain-containing protein [Streptomyces sp. NPDC020965]|uniref:DUF4349 domain-containing protein n=1 Tax=Streptomyces sp. NPDC020965 TaxID=3365105 RepID=UPI003798EF45